LNSVELFFARTLRLAASKLGQIESKKALDTLLECIDSEVIQKRPNGEGYAVIRWIVIAVGGYVGKLDGYRNADIYNRLEHIVRNESYPSSPPVKPNSKQDAMNNARTAGLH
jgi:hypothetical protein